MNISLDIMNKIKKNNEIDSTHILHNDKYKTFIIYRNILLDNNLLTKDNDKPLHQRF